MHRLGRPPRELEELVSIVQSKIFVLQGKPSCWLWTGSTVRGGYGQIRYRGVIHKIHRLVWELTFGKLPRQILVCHSCDEPRCVNLSHLFLGTAQDNMDDMRDKGRECFDKAVRGERHFAAKLKESDVIEIRRLKAQGVRTVDLVKRFGVCSVQINSIVRREYWKHI